MDAEKEEDEAQRVADIEGDLGDDVFEKSGGAAEADTGKEAWVLEGRQATYPEVSSAKVLSVHADRVAAAETVLHSATCAQPRAGGREEEVYDSPTPGRERRNEKDSVRQLDRHLQKDAPTARARLAVLVLGVGNDRLDRRRPEIDHEGKVYPETD